MRCPACQTEMFVLEFERIEVDYCYECGGVWLDSGELELIGERAGCLEGELLKALEGAGSPTQGKRPCPVCRKAMLEARTDTRPPIVVDRCTAAHGLWFDRGELGAVVRAAGAEEDNVLARFFAGLGSPPREAGPD